MFTGSYNKTFSLGIMTISSNNDHCFVNWKLKYKSRFSLEKITIRSNSTHVQREEVCWPAVAVWAEGTCVSVLPATCLPSAAERQNSAPHVVSPAWPWSCRHAAPKSNPY